MNLKIVNGEEKFTRNVVLNSVLFYRDRDRMGLRKALNFNLQHIYVCIYIYDLNCHYLLAVATAAKSLQSCPTLCDPRNSSPPGSPIPGVLQARMLEWVAISFSNAWKWKVKLKSLSRVWLFATPWTADYQAPPSMGFSRQEYWSGVPVPSPLSAWGLHLLICNSLMGFPCSSVGKESAYHTGDLGSIPWSGRSPEEGNGNPLQYSCMENPMDRGAWQAVFSSWSRKNWTWFSN